MHSHAVVSWLTCASLVLASSVAAAQAGAAKSDRPGPGPAAANRPSRGPMGNAGMMGRGGPMGGRGMMGDDGDGDACPMMDGGGMMMGGDHDGSHMHLRMIERMADELGLPEATRKKIQDLVYEAKKQAIPMHSELEQATLELQRAMDQDKPDTDAVLKLFDRVSQAKSALARLHLRTMLDVQKLLSPEQRKKLRGHMMKGMGGR